MPLVEKLGQWVRLSNSFVKDHSFAELAMVYFPIGEIHHGWGIYWKYNFSKSVSLQQIQIEKHIARKRFNLALRPQLANWHNSASGLADLAAVLGCHGIMGHD